MYLITLVPSEDNIKNDSKVYTAKHVREPLEMLDKHNPEEILSPEIVELSNDTVGTFSFLYYQVYNLNNNNYLVHDRNHNMFKR